MLSTLDWNRSARALRMLSAEGWLRLRLSWDVLLRRRSGIERDPTIQDSSHHTFGPRWEETGRVILATRESDRGSTTDGQYHAYCML